MREHEGKDRMDIRVEEKRQEKIKGRGKGQERD